VTQTWKYEKITQKLENHLEQDINVIQLQTRQVQGTGLVRCGKEKLWQVEKLVGSGVAKLIVEHSYLVWKLRHIGLQEHTMAKLKNYPNAKKNN
tara:strand:- start:171 stop:452 length:282 start_codon:yes stop_codon:yes gene_type:complete